MMDYLFGLHPLDWFVLVVGLVFAGLCLWANHYPRG